MASPRPSRRPDTSESVARQLNGRAHNEASNSPLLEAKMLFRLVRLKRETPDSIRVLIGTSNAYRRSVLRLFECLLNPRKARVIVQPVVVQPIAVKEPEPEVEICEPVAVEEPEPEVEVRKPVRKRARGKLRAEEIVEAEQLLRAGKTWPAVVEWLGSSKSVLYRNIQYRKGKRRK